MRGKPHGIIVLEGADGTGKTTLAKHLVEKHGARYLHLGIHKDIWAWHVAALRLAARLADDHLVVIDRHWVSEQVYGQVFRGGPAYDLGARCLDRVLQKHGALMIVCVRDLRTHLDHFEKLRKERPEKFDSMRTVAVRYFDLMHGNVAHPGDTYLDQLIRFGDFAGRLDVMGYDMDQFLNGGRIRHFVDRALERLRNVRAFQGEGLEFRHDNLAGSIAAARYLFVGEAMRDNHPIHMPRWPFFYNDTMSSATWLNRSLHELKFNETRGLWTNARSGDDWLPALLGLQKNLKVIAIGKVAAKRIRILNGNAPDAEIEHPQHARRFNHNDPAGYTQRLKEALA